MRVMKAGATTLLMLGAMLSLSCGGLAAQHGKESRPVAEFKGHQRPLFERAPTEREAPVAGRGAQKPPVLRPSAAAAGRRGGSFVGGVPGMKRIPGGKFLMGANDVAPYERPVHEVTVRTFWMDETEVTVDAYKKCVDEGKCATPRSVSPADNWGTKGRGNHPVNGVNWEDAVTYCKWLGKRLPTEEEWEYAARGGAKQWKYTWGNHPEPGAQLCWGGEGNDMGKGQRRSTCSVGSYPSGAFGLKDMAGNVSEWTSSGYSHNYAMKRDSRYRVLRGGNWITYPPFFVRGAYRSRVTPSYRNFTVGFRCARS